jgi:spore maturation protein SpmB
VSNRSIYVDGASWLAGSDSHGLIGGVCGGTTLSAGETGPIKIGVDGSVAVNLSDTDNAVLDTIDAVLDTIKVDTEAIETAVESIQSGQLANGHNVVVTSAPTTAVTGTFWQATQPISGTVTATGTITAELSSEDNAVLNTIDAVLDTIKIDTEAIETAVEAIQSGQLSNGHNVVVTSAPTTAVTGTFWQATQPVSGTVTAELSGVDRVTLGVIDSVLDTIDAVLDTIKVDTEAIETAVELIDDSIYADDAAWTDGSSKHTLTGGVYQATPPSITDGDTAPLQLNVNGQLKTYDSVANTYLSGIRTSVQLLDNAIDGNEMQVDIVSGGFDGAVTGTFWQATQPVSGTFWQATQPVSGTITAELSGTDNAVLDAMVVDLAAMEVLLTGIDADTNAIKTAVEILDNAISGSEMQVDVVTNQNNSTMTSGHNNDVDTTAEVLEAGSEAIRRIDMQAFSTNKGTIYVGDSNIDTDGTAGGIALSAGDFYSIEVDDKDLVYVVASQDNQKISYNIFK